jgi:hypothetical protein
MALITIPMDIQDFIDGASSRLYTMPRKLAFAFPAITAVLAVLLPNRTRELSDYLVYWFIQPKGILFLICVATLGYGVGKLWIHESTSRKILAVVITVAYIVFAVWGYWNFGKL